LVLMLAVVVYLGLPRMQNDNIILVAHLVQVKQVRYAVGIGSNVEKKFGVTL